MKEILASITDVLGPAGSDALVHAIFGLLILVVGLVIVNLIAGAFGKVLAKVGFLKDGNLDAPVTSLIKAVLTIFVLIAVLEHFDLTNVLEPLKNMANEFMAAVPRIIGAGVVGYAGWIIAKIVSELVGIVLGKADQQLAARTGSDEIKISALGRALVFAAVFLPILVAALGVLSVPAISVPASAMVGKLMAALPNIIGATIILVVTFLVARFAIFILTSLLNSVQADTLPARIGLDGMFSESFTVTRFVGALVMFFSMLTAATAAVSTLGIEMVSVIFASVLDFGGRILVGAVILLVGNLLGTLAYNKLAEGGNAVIANIARVAILGLVLAMGLKAMGLADNIVNLAFGFTIGGAAVAGAIAFGLGGRDAAKVIADNWAARVTKD